MAHFYGTLKGSRGEATRCGTKSSGLTVIAASWSGAVGVELYQHSETGEDMAHVYLREWHGRGMSRSLYDGPVSGMLPDHQEELNSTRMRNGRGAR